MADLVVVGSPDNWVSNQLRRNIVRALLEQAPAPLLLLPAGRSVHQIGHAALAWREGPHAMRAARELVRLAAPGAKVDVIAISRDRDCDVTPIVDYLNRHGLSAEPNVLAPAGHTARRFETFALERGADVLACGAFDHSPTREALFGGVTQTLIADPRIPILTVH